MNWCFTEGTKVIFKWVTMEISKLYLPKDASQSLWIGRAEILEGSGSDKRSVRGEKIELDVTKQSSILCQQTVSSKRGMKES